MNSVSDTSHDLKKVIDSPEATIYQGDALRALRSLEEVVWLTDEEAAAEDEAEAEAEDEDEATADRGQQG